MTNAVFSASPWKTTGGPFDGATAALARHNSAALPAHPGKVRCTAVNGKGLMCGWHNPPGAPHCARRTCCQPLFGGDGMRQTTLPSPFGTPQRPANQQFFAQQQRERQPRGARLQQPPKHTKPPLDLQWPPLDEQLPPVPPEFADAQCAQKWMPFSNPNGTNILLFVQGANRARWKSVKAWRKQVLDEGLDDFELSSIPKELHVPVACPLFPPTVLPQKTNSTSSPLFANSAAASNTAAPTLAAQISKYQNAIRVNKELDQPTEGLEEKLRALQAQANAAPSTKTTYGKAKAAFDAAKAAKAKQVRLVATKTLELQDEQAKLDELATSVANAKKLADEKFAEEEKETGRQRTTIHLAKLAEGEVPVIDVSSFLGLDGSDPEADERKRVEVNEAFSLFIAPLLAERNARKDLAKMAVDTANGTEHPAPDPDLPDPKRRAGEAPDGSQGQTVLPGGATPLVPTDAAAALPAFPPGAAASASSGGTGGSASPLQATPQKPKPQSEAARKAADRKEKLDALEAEIEAQSNNAAVARALAVNVAITAQAVDKAPDAMDDDYIP